MTSAHVQSPIAIEPSSATAAERERLAERARLREGAKERVALAFPRSTDYLGLARKVTADLARRAGFPREEIDKIELAVDEACTNAAVYQAPRAEGPDEVELEVVIDRPRFVVTLRDRGSAFEFDARGNFDLEDHLRRPEPGGLGIYIIKNFMDEVSYEHTARGNVLTMVKLLACS